MPQLPTRGRGRRRRCRAYFNVWRWVQKQRAERRPHRAGDGDRGDALRDRSRSSAGRELARDAGDVDRRTSRRATAGTTCRRCSSSSAATPRSPRSCYAWLAEGDAQYGAGVPEIPQRAGPEMTVRIDSKVGEDIAEGGGQTTRHGGCASCCETVGKTEWPGRKVPEEYAALVEQAQPQGAGGRRERTGDAQPRRAAGARCALHHLRGDAVGGLGRDHGDARRRPAPVRLATAVRAGGGAGAAAHVLRGGPGDRALSRGDGARSSACRSS